MTPTTKTKTTDIKRKQCERCHVCAGSHHPIGNFVVRLEHVSFGGEKQLLCPKCRMRAEIKAQKPSTVDRSRLFAVKKWWKSMKRLIVIGY